MYRYALSVAVGVFALPALGQSPQNSLNLRGSQTTQAAEPQINVTLTLAVALAQAMASNPELAAAQHELDASEGTVMQAGIFPNPSVEIGVEDTRRETRESTLLFSQPIELGGKRAARVHVAQKERDAAVAQLHVKRAEIHASVLSTFVDVLAAQEKVTLGQSLLDLAKRSTDIAVRRVASGKVSPVEETKARIALANVQLELVQARSELATARNRLGATLGVGVSSFATVAGDLTSLPELPDFALLTEQLSISPSLMQAQTEVERRRALAQLEQKRGIPDITVGLGVKRVEEQGRNQAVLRISMPLPFFDRNQGNQIEALRRADKAQDEFRAAKLRLNNELAQAYQKLDVARQEVQALQNDILPSSQSAYQAAVKGFEFGKFGFLDVLDSQRTLLQANSHYMRAFAEGHRAAADIERLLGRPLFFAKQ